MFQIRELILKCDLWYYQCLKIFSCFRIVNPIILVLSALVIKYNCYCLKELVNNDGLSTLKHPKKLYRFFMHVIITTHRMNHNYRPVKQKNAWTNGINMSCFLQSPALNGERQTLKTPRLIVFVLFVVKTGIFLSVSNKELVLLLISLISERDFFEKTCISARPFNTCTLLYLPIMFRAAQQKSRLKVTIGNPTNNGEMGRVTA